MRETQDKSDIRAVAPGISPGTGCPCVVWVSPGASRPEVLLRGLANRGAEVRLVSDAPSVMVELAGGAKAVVINEPQMVRRSGELLAAVRRYYPGVMSWRFNMIGPKGHPSLERMNGEVGRVAVANGSSASVTPPANGTAKHDMAQSEPPIERPPSPTVSMRDAAKVEPPKPAAPPPAPQRPASPPPERRVEPPVPAPLLTPEELAMLLAPLPTEDEDRVNIRDKWDEEEEQK